MAKEPWDERPDWLENPLATMFCRVGEILKENGEEIPIFFPMSRRPNEKIVGKVVSPQAKAVFNFLGEVTQDIISRTNRCHSRIKELAERGELFPCSGLSEELCPTCRTKKALINQRQVLDSFQHLFWSAIASRYGFDGCIGIRDDWDVVKFSVPEDKEVSEITALLTEIERSLAAGEEPIFRFNPN